MYSRRINSHIFTQLLLLDLTQICYVIISKTVIFIEDVCST
jgi:hypothetical protein